MHHNNLFYSEIHGDSGAVGLHGAPGGRVKGELPTVGPGTQSVLA